MDEQIKPDTRGMPWKQYMAIKDRLSGEPKEKISISINPRLKRVADEVLEKEYSSAAFSKLVEALVEEFLHFHHPSYFTQGVDAVT